MTCSRIHCRFCIQFFPSNQGRLDAQGTAWPNAFVHPQLFLNKMTSDNHPQSNRSEVNRPAFWLACGCLKILAFSVDELTLSWNMYKNFSGHAKRIHSMKW